MKFSIASILFLLSSTTFAYPQSAPALQERDALATILNPRSPKGGGGGGGRGGGGGSSGSSGGGRSGSSSSSSSSSSSGGGGVSSGGGRGSPKSFGGGRYYGGGSAAPYTAGRSSPRGIAPVALVGGALLIYPGLWLYGAYAYPYGRPYSYYNRTARRNRTATATAPTRRSLVGRFFEIEARQETETGVNETKPVTCLCAMNAECGCDEGEDTTFLDQVIGDGDYSKLNASLVQIADINGTSTIVLNGTLEAGTTDTISAASTLSIGGSMVGYWVMMVLVGFTCFLV